MNFDQLISCVNLEKGYFAVGFMFQTDERREQIRFGRTETEEANQAFADAIVEPKSQQTKSLWQRALGWLPRELLLAAIQEYTASLKYRHCEVAMYLNESGKQTFGESKVLGIGLTSNEGVFIMARRYNEEYQWQHVPCDAATMYAIAHFAWTERRKPFCATKMTNLTLYPGPDHRDQYYCAQFIMACLEFLPIADFHLNPCNKLTIDDVYDLVTRKRNSASRVDEVPATEMHRILGDRLSVGPPLRVDKDKQQMYSHPV